MSSDNHRAFIVSSNLGRAHDYDPTIFPLTRLKRKDTLEAGNLFISTSLREITMARRLIRDQLEFKRIFEDVEHQCNRMTTQGKELQRRSKTWNPRRWLGVRRDIKKFSETSFDLYILTVRKSKIIDQSPLAFVVSEDITPVSVDEVSPTEPVAGMLVTVDDDVDIDRANHDIAEAMNELTSTYELQENFDADYSDTLSIASSELSYFSARTSCETDQSNPCSMVPPADHWPPTTSSLPSAIDSFSPVNPPPMSPPLTSPSPTSPPPTSSPPTGPPPTSPLPTGPPPVDPPPTPTATSSPRANSPPLALHFHINTMLGNILIPALSDLRLYSGNGSNFTDRNTGIMETFPQDFMPTSPSN